MHVSGFMIPAEKVVAVSPDDTVRAVMDAMLENKIGSVIVIKKEKKKPKDGEEKHVETLLPMPVGIITKSDILKAYQGRLGVDARYETIMSKDDLATCSPNMTRDQAARILEKTHHHHIIVVDDQHEHFLGLVSSWDITVECAKDDRAWPWIRSQDGKVHGAKEEKKTMGRAVSPRTAAVTADPSVPLDGENKETIYKHEHDEFTTYMDELDLLCLM